MRVSVVIPAFNEEGNIGRLIEETFAKVPVDALGEVLAVDDGSDDGTGAEIKALLSKYKALRYLRHGRRSGQSAALRTGVAAARFPVIATMDGKAQAHARQRRALPIGSAMRCSPMAARTRGAGSKFTAATPISSYPISP